MADTQLLTTLLIAGVALFILIRLYMVLGRRTGHERPPQESYELGASSPESPSSAAPKVAIPAPDRPSDPVASGLFDIGLADRSFDKDQFLKGAQAAYEMILTAFAACDRDTLKPLLSAEVFAAFDTVMKKREADKLKASITLVGFSEVKITAASLKNMVAEVTISFAARLISSTTDAEDKIVEGDASAVQDVTDIWTFTRDVRARDPNWQLVATSSEPS